ncbi:MAG: hypothetical protein AAFP76_00655 [Bacteroidota bacterium]
MLSKKPLLFILLIVFAGFFSACEEEEESVPEEEEIEINSVSIIPSTTSGRPNNFLGCIEINSRITTIEVWDHGQIDGDIVSIIANGNTIINQEVLDGPGNPIRVDYDFGFNGFNYVTLFAHNLGDLPPNTCTIAINGVEFILEANLDANGSIDVVVSGFGVDCSAGGGTSGGTGGGGSGGGTGGGGTGGGGTGSTTGDVIFWTNQDFGCGPITVNVNGIGSTSITGFYPGGAPNCSQTGAGGNFNSLDAGTYSFDASCDGITWQGDFTVNEGSCLRFQLTN